MRAFLIDFENVKSAGLTGIEALTKEDKVIILYSVNSNTISFEMHQKIITCQAQVEYYQIRRGGKNSLDFQLSTLLGWLLASGEYSHLYIISNDSGFDALYDFWNSGYIPTDCIVYRRSTLTLADLHSQANRRTLPVETADPEDMSLPDRILSETLEEVTEEPQPEEAEQELDIINVIDLFAPAQAPLPHSSDLPEPPQRECLEPLFNPDEDEDEGLSLEALLATSPIAAPAPEKKPARQEETDPRILRVAAALPAALSDIVTDEHRERIAQDVVTSRGKQEFYRDIIRRYGQKKGLLVYKTVKSEYTTLKKLADA